MVWGLSTGRILLGIDARYEIRGCAVSEEQLLCAELFARRADPKYAGI